MVRYPNESDAYRAARRELLAEEIALRAQIERVAALRRALPPGGQLQEDYAFAERVPQGDVTTRLSDLFGDHDELFVYSFMYGDGAACPMCTALLDGLDGQVLHLRQRIATAVVAKTSLDRIHAHAASRGWRRLRLLSSGGTTYNADYHGEIDGRQHTNANVFHRADDGTIRHVWGAEMGFAQPEPGQNMRHVDALWPLWNVLDLTRGGRGDWYPRLTY